MKQTFNIPEGCKVVTVEQIGNQLITSFEPEKYVPKVGDFVKIIYPSGNSYFCEVSAVDGYKIASKNVVIINDGLYFGACGKHFTQSSIEKLTPEEFQAEFDKLGYVYDFETHTAHKKRWRAGHGETYYFVSGTFEIEPSTETGNRIDKGRYESGNYFKNEKDAEPYRDYMLQHSLNFHKNNQ